MSEDEIKTLKIFVANAKKLHAAVEKHVPSSKTIHYEVDKEIQTDGFVDETAEAGLVANARLFMGDNVAEFGRVVNILSKYHQGDAEKVSQLREYKKAWKRIFGLHPLFRVATDNNEMTAEKVFDIMAYGNHLHSGNFDEHFALQNSWIYPMIKILLEDLIVNVQKLTSSLYAEFVNPYLESNDP